MPATDVSVQRNAAAQLYHQWITGQVLTLLNHQDVKTAERFVFELFRTQHLQRFLPGLKKLGLDNQPDAVACAKYHYFSNQLGGVKVEYFAESDTKAWVRYPPPRWIWDGTAICAIPSSVNLQMMRGWHAHNGVSLGNPKLGFICTGMTTNGAPGLEGYYREFDHELSESERLQFSPNEQCPPIDPASMPTLDAANWPTERQAKASLNYAMEYIRNSLPLLESILGQAQAAKIGGLCARQIGMHNSDSLASAFSLPSASRNDFAQMLSDLIAIDGSQVSIENQTVTVTDWRLFDASVRSTTLIEIVTQCFAGILSVRDRFAQLTVSHDGNTIRWRVV